MARKLSDQIEMNTENLKILCIMRDKIENSRKEINCIADNLITAIYKYEQNILEASRFLLKQDMRMCSNEFTVDMTDECEGCD